MAVRQVQIQVVGRNEKYVLDEGLVQMGSKFVYKAFECEGAQVHFRLVLAGQVFQDQVLLFEYDKGTSHLRES